MTVAPVHHVSEGRVRECEASARFWAEELGPFANQMNEHADRYALISAALSSLTGLAVWTTLVASTEWPAVLLVSIVAFTSAFVALIPKIKGYSACAKAATALSSRYGAVLGELVDAAEMYRRNSPDASLYAEAVVKKFEEIRKEKEDLKPYPSVQRERLKAMRAAGSDRKGRSPHNSARS